MRKSSHQKKGIEHKTGYTVGVSILTIMLACLFLSSTSFFCWCKLSPWLFPISVVAGFTYALLASQHYRSLLYLAGILIISLVFSLFTVDVSFDGVGYHQYTIIFLAEGWNPWYDPAPEGASLWTINYARALEVIQACIVLTTDNLQCGRMANLMLYFAAWAFTWDFIRPYSTPKKCFWVTLAVMANPVVISQLPTYYIDFSLYCYIVILLVALISKQYSCTQLYVIFTVCVLAIGTKFNMALFAGLTVFFAMIWLLYRKRGRDALILGLTGLIALAISLVYLFYNPYITNYLNHGHILYPLMGEGKVDIMTAHMPEIYAGHSRVVNFFINLIYPYLNCSDRLWFIPWSFFTYYETRAGGFGAFMILMLVLTAIYIFRNRKALPALVYYLIGCVVVSCFIFEQSWWARYIPQLWLLPCIVLVYGLWAKRFNLWAKAICALAILSMLFSLSNLDVSRRTYHNRALVYEELHGETIVAHNLLLGERYDLEKHGIVCLDSDCVPSGPTIMILPAKVGTKLHIDSAAYNRLRQRADDGFITRKFIYTPLYLFPADTE